MPDAHTCARCGRTGSRGYTTQGEPPRSVCVSRTACRKRRKYRARARMVDVYLPDDGPACLTPPPAVHG